MCAPWPIKEPQDSLLFVMYTVTNHKGRGEQQRRKGILLDIRELDGLPTTLERYDAGRLIAAQ